LSACTWRKYRQHHDGGECCACYSAQDSCHRTSSVGNA
jgi:hypothetical protein